MSIPSALIIPGVLCICFQSVSAEVLPHNEAQGFLKFAAVQLQSSCEAVETLTGDFELIQRVLVENPTIPQAVDLGEHDDLTSEAVTVTELSGLFILERPIRGTFCVDVPGDRLASTYSQSGATRLVSVDGKVLYEANEVIETESVLTASDFYFVRYDEKLTRMADLPELPEDTDGYCIVYRRPPETGRKLSRLSQVFDPRRHFEAGNRQLHVLVAQVAEWMERGELDVVVDETMDAGGRNGTYTVTYSFPGGDRMEKRFRREGRDLIPLTDKVTAGDSSVFSTEWEHEQVDGVSVPVVASYTQLNPDGLLVAGRETRLSNLSLNVVLSDDEFLPTRFRVDPLDRMVDEVDDEVYVFTRQGIVPARSFSMSTMPETGELLKDQQPGSGSGVLSDRLSRPWGLILVGVNVVLAVVWLTWCLSKPRS